MLVLFALLALAFSVQAQMKNEKGEMKGEMKADAAKTITQMEEQWASDSKMGKVDAIAPMLAENFIELDSDGSLYTKTQAVDRMKGAKWEANEISDVKVTTHGNTAIATGAWRGKGTVAGKSVDAHEHWIDTWMKMPGGKWQCIASASAPTKM